VTKELKMNSCMIRDYISSLGDMVPVADQALG